MLKNIRTLIELGFFIFNNDFPIDFKQNYEEPIKQIPVILFCH